MKSIFLTLWNVSFTLVIYALGIIIFSIAMIPALNFLYMTWPLIFYLSSPLIIKFFLFAVSMAVAFFMYGFSLMLLIGLIRIIFRIRLEEGEYPLKSLQAFKWAFVSSLYLIIHHTFADYILATPFANAMFHLMGVRLGKHAHFISKNVFDATLLEIGDGTVVGGSAVIIAHTVERSTLILKKVKIGKNVTIGDHAIIMPGCEIGDGAIIGSHAVVLKDTKIGPREVWIGIPAELKK